MALGKYSRVDGRKSSSNYCSTVTIVVFVALCLVGVWMMTSSSVVPVQNSNLSTLHENNNEANEKPQVSAHDNDLDTSSNENKIDNNEKPQVSDAHDNNLDTSSNENKIDNESGLSDNEGKVKQFEDNPGDLPEDATKGDNNVNSNQEDNNSSSHETENSSEVNTLVKKDEAESKAEEGSQTDTGNGEDDKGDSEKKSAGQNESETLETNEANAGEVDSGGVQKSDSDEKAGETTDLTKDDGHVEEELDETKDSGEKSVDGLSKDQSSNEVLPSVAQSDLLNESTVQNGSFSTQKAKSKNEKEAQESSEPGKQSGYHWKLCNVTAGPDYIPCLDNLEAIRHLRSTKHYEHRERHCPDNPPTCLVSLPDGYQPSIEWPMSREKIWYHNVPHTKLAEVKGHQNWVKFSGEYLTFPGGGTQFKNGALHYIDFIQKSVPDVAWGKRSRVVLDVGCGVASFGGYLFDRDVLTMSLAPKDEHEAQIQFALERGIPAISAVMGTKRLPFPGRAFDVVHCARCRVPWHIEGGKLLLELNRLLRPGGFFIWSATPVYQKLPEDVEIWDAMKKLTKAMCWEVVSIIKDKINSVGIAIYRKPLTNECYERRPEMEPPLCSDSDDPSAAWNVALQACIHKVPAAETERGSKWPESWPARLQKPPYWLLSSQVGVYGKPAPDDFATDYEHWKRVVNKSYLNGLGINWSTVRNVMDMRAIYGGFAAALRDMKLWVMNVVSIDAPDTLPIIYERGLFGIYHDWCESFSTYPRSYDLLHADHLFSKIKRKCNFLAFVVEVDRILRPGGKLIVRDHVDTINELESMFKSMQWEIRMTYAKDNEGLLCVHKTMWRPKEMETVTYAIA